MDEQLLGQIKGKEALAKSFEGLRGNPDFRNYPKNVVVEKDYGVAIWNIQSPLPSGSKLDVKGANFYRIKDGKIFYFANYHDTLPFKNME